MGIYLNPGKGRYQIALNSQIYVDKTEMIRYLNTLVNTNQRYVSVSRPRRFGKTMAVDMLCAYYDRMADSRSLFETRKVALSQATEPTGEDPWDSFLGKFDVIRRVMTDFMKEDKSVKASLELMTARILRDLSKTYPTILLDTDDLGYSMEECYAKTGIPHSICLMSIL